MFFCFKSLILSSKGDFMTVKLQFYKCDVCGNIVQIFHEGDGALVCCGEEMKLLQPKTDEQMAEKHVPKFFTTDSGQNFVQVGSVPHPMSEEHYIEFIQVIADDNKTTITKFLDSNQEPKFIFNQLDNFNRAYEYCNLHNLWEGDRD